MPHLLVTVDGQTRYQGDVPDTYLPTQPQQFPTALGAGADPNTPPTPLARLMVLTALTELIRRTLESPMLQPLDVDLQTRGMGCFTLVVDSPTPQDGETK